MGDGRHPRGGDRTSLPRIAFEFGAGFECRLIKHGMFLPLFFLLSVWQGYEGDPEHVANAEKYFLCVSKIPRLELRLQLFAFKQGFETQV